MTRLFRSGILALAVFALCPAGAQQPSVEAYVEPASGITDADAIRLVVRIEGGERQEVLAPELPPLTNLKVLGGPSTSDQFQWVNGQTRHSVSFIYTLRAEAPGPAEIPSFDVTVGGRTFQTDPIRIEVAEAPRGRPAPGRAPAPGGVAANDVFLEARIAQDEVWVGEPVSLSVTLYSAVRVGLDALEEPSLSEFWVEQDDVNPEAESRRVQLGGRSYRAYPLKRSVLIPSSAGEHTIEPFVGQLSVQVSDGSFFSFGRSQPVVRKTEALKIRVRALPQAGRPADFSRAVGRFEMSVEMDRDEATVDDAVALEVSVSGEGFLKPVQPPAIDAPPDLKVFPPRDTERMTIRGGRMVSRKDWEWVVVPLAAGELRMPPVRFSYFDTEAGTYRTLSGDELLLSVRRGEGRGGSGAGAGTALRAQRRDVAFIKTRRGETLATRRPRVHERPSFVTLMMMPFVVVPLVIVLGRRRSRIARDVGLARSRRARSRAVQKLKASRRRGATLDRGTFHEGIARTLVEYVADRFNLPAAGLTYDRIDELLGSRGVDGELRGRFRRCLESCDFARFVPSAGSAERRHDQLAEASTLVDELERAL